MSGNRFRASSTADPDPGPDPDPDPDSEVGEQALFTTSTTSAALFVCVDEGTAIAAVTVTAAFAVASISPLMQSKSFNRFLVAVEVS